MKIVKENKLIKKSLNILSKKLEKIDFILVTASTVICSLFSFAYSVYAKKYVLPLEYGIYTTCLLLQTYLNYAQLGVMNSYNRDYPQFLGAEKSEEARKLKNTAFCFVILIYLILMIIVDSAILLLYSNALLEKHYFWGYLLCPITVLLETIASFCIYTERMEGRYNMTAAVSLIKTVAAIILGLFAIKKWFYYGLYIMPITGSLLSIAFYFKTSLKTIRFKIDITTLKYSIHTGLPLLINSLVWTIMSSVDKFIILFFMTTEDLGVYSVPLMGFSTMVIVPQTISQIFYYKISRIYGETNSTHKLIDQCNQYTLLTSACTGITAIVAYYLLPILVDIFMPNYHAGIKPAQILIVGVAIYSATLLYSNIFSVLKLNLDLLVNTVVLCIFNIVTSTLFVMINGRQVENVAVGTAMSYFLYSLLLLLRIHKRFNYNLRKLIMSGWFPVAVSIVPCLLFEKLFHSNYVAMIVSIFTAGIVYITVFIQIWRKKNV
ncbi:lipopolysaccharide biosynthesis protein [Hungatella hathewayi]|uniref:lipopolysaccharide biosynthesis protein n=1 Tax=Hungatella hathewayi TaxID=154046 RepID=UPI00054F11D7|nr:oligosaccharide flippase family protein [Hungatella hathewayi]